MARRFLQPELARLPKPQLIEEISADRLIGEIKASVLVRWDEVRAERPDLPALDALGLETEPLTVLIEAFAYRETVLRALVNDKARAVLLAYATGSILSIVQLVAGLVPTVKGILDAATSNESIVTKVKDVSAPLAGVLEEVGTFLLLPNCMSRPARSPLSIRTCSLNVLLDPSPKLAVDGLYGPMTRNAVECLQAKLGLKVDGWAGEITKAAIAAALTKLN